jgi:hypothetical protein
VLQPEPGPGSESSGWRACTSRPSVEQYEEPSLSKAASYMARPVAACRRRGGEAAAELVALALSAAANIRRNLLSYCAVA